MKKIATAILVLFVCFVASASIFDDFSFSFVGDGMIHEQYKADSWNFITRAQYGILGEESAGLTDFLVISRYEEGHEESYLNFDQAETPYLQDYAMEVAHFTEEDGAVDNFLRLKPAISLSLLRIDWSEFKIAAVAQIGMNMVINASGNTDVIGFDGLYAYGVECGYSDWITMHFLMHHYSGHYSDEVEEDFYNSMVDDYGRRYRDRIEMAHYEYGAITRAIEYIRQDSCQIGLAFSPVSWARVYGEVDFIPKHVNYINPYVICPNGRLRNGDQDAAGRYGWNNGLFEDDVTDRRYEYSDKYQNLMLECGAEFTVPVWKLGTLDVAYDVKFLQEGQTYYQFAAYKETNPWYVDHNVLLSFSPENKPFAIEVIYHNGCFPLLNWNWYHCSYVSLGMSLTI